MALDNAMLYREAQEAVQVRDAFLSVASHELKTPLTSLLGFMDLLQRRVTPGTVIGEREQRRITVAAEQAHRLSKMVSSLLDLSRLQMGQLSIEREPVDLSALVQRIADEVEPTLPASHQLDLQISSEPLLVIGDDLRLEQVIQNLLQNAVKYSPHGGPISLRLDQHAGFGRIAVRDQGLGIPGEALSQIFTRFFRAENAASYQVNGMGVGLYVVQQIVELHGGQVSVESEEGQGSTFTVLLPLAHSTTNLAGEGRQVAGVG
jgi:signal transduction histidine kinase